MPPEKIVRASLDTGYTEEWLYAGEGEIRQTLHKEGVVHERRGGYRPDSLIINRELLRDILEGVEEGLKVTGLTLPPNKKAQLILMLCDLYTIEKKVDKAKVIDLIRLAA